MKLLVSTAAFLALSSVDFGATVLFSTGNVTNSIAVAARPSTAGKFEIEAADDFVLNATSTLISSATFTGLLTGSATAADISQIVIEIYRVFPNDSDVGRTSGAPTFSTSLVPTRINSPSDIALDGRDSAAAELTFTTASLGSFSAVNSVLPGGIHPKPGQTTGGSGPVTGNEIQITANFKVPFTLAPGHYFFVPQVAIGSPNAEFLWLSGTRPIVAPGTPFTPDLQSWTRDQFLDPDWLRVGTDIVGAGTFNGAFVLSGVEIPEPSAAGLTVGGLGMLLFARRWMRR